MKDNKSDKKIKNKASVMVGTLTGLFLIIFFYEFLQYGVAHLFDAQLNGMGFGPVTFYADYTLPDGVSTFYAAFIHLFPFLFCILLTDLIVRALPTTKPDIFRYTIILTFLLNTGYLMIKAFYSTFVYILNSELSTDWNNFIALYDFSVVLKLLLSVVVLVMIVSFVGIKTGKIKIYINA